jgi:hypothetical protein
LTLQLRPSGYAISLAPSLQSSTSMLNLSSSELVIITGGAPTAKPAAPAAPTFSDFENSLHSSLQNDYKSLVCEAAGYQGGPLLAQQMYGANATDSDKQRATKLVTDYCNAGTQLPIQAPKFPF